MLAHVIRLITLEYKGKSAIKMSPKDHRGKLLMCASTFPITHVVREMVLENFTLADLGEGSLLFCQALPSPSIALAVRDMY